MIVDDPVHRYLRIGSMWSRIMTRRGKFEIQAILHSAASLTSLVSSIHDSSTCLLVKQHRQIPCIAWVWQAHTRPWKWPAMYPTGPRRPGWSGSEPFTVRQVTTGEKSMKRKTLIPTSSLPECEHLHRYVMILIPCPTYPLINTQGKDQLLLQIQWSQLQR